MYTLTLSYRILAAPAEGKVRGSSGFYWHTIAGNTLLPQRR
jgi:hypothetical protein